MCGFAQPRAGPTRDSSKKRFPYVGHGEETLWCSRFHTSRSISTPFPSPLAHGLIRCWRQERKRYIDWMRRREKNSTHVDTGENDMTEDGSRRVASRIPFAVPCSSSPECSCRFRVLTRRCCPFLPLLDHLSGAEQVHFFVISPGPYSQFLPGSLLLAVVDRVRYPHYMLLYLTSTIPLSLTDCGSVSYSVR